MMKIKNIAGSLMCVSAWAVCLQSCESGRSYAELLEDKKKSVNRFLLNQIVENAIPADTVFEVGPDAPYYQLDGEQNIYMQVLSLGDDGKPEDDDVVYFRFLRYNLNYYQDGDYTSLPSEGNQDNLTEAPTSFRFNNYSLPSSSQWGSGIQLPLNYIPLGSEINLIVKSQYGWSSEISYVMPFLYHVRYYRSQI